MNWFASRGFDTWTFDCRGYGQSYKQGGFKATISDGADDIAAAADYVREQSGASELLVYGISSGALRAALYAERHPQRVSRLALDAMVWTGQGSPTLIERAKKIDQWRSAPRRPLNREFLMSIFTRDHAGTADERIIGPFIDQVLEHDDSIPNGTYIDMCTNLPVCDPEKIDLVMSLKFAGRVSHAPMMAAWMARAGHELIAEAEMIAPVPMHWLRLARRHHNQAALLACHIKAGTNSRLVPDLLVRRRNTRPQIGLSASARARNLTGAFALARSCEVKGRSLLLVDDVFTTGATAVACARVLKRAGAARVDVLTFARVAGEGEMAI